VLGSFCVVDRKPRQWDAEDRIVLEQLAEAALATAAANR
jgi:GAF domain-containing protein